MALNFIFNLQMDDFLEVLGVIYLASRHAKFTKNYHFLPADTQH